MSIENKYLLQKIEEKKYLFPQQSFSESLQIIFAILCIIFVLGAFYTRDLKIDIPKNYFDEYPLDVLSAHQVLLEDFQISEDLSDISKNISDSPESAYQKLKSDTQLLKEMRMLYEQYKDMNIEKNTTYVYNNLFDLNRVKILYAQYEINNKNINHGVEIYRNIFQNNQKILEANNGIIGSLVYLSVQKPSLESLNTHKYLFRESQQASILENIKNIDTQDIFRNAFSHEINTAHGYMKFVLKVPLFLDIYEMKKIDQYYKYTIIQNNGEMDENILFSPQFTRANYIGMFFLNTAQTQYTSQFQKFHELESIIAELKK